MQIREIKSKITSETLHYVIKFTENNANVLPRIDVISPENFLQLSILSPENGKKFKAHKHIYKNIDRQVIAQESWIILKGKAKAFFYDLDDSLLDEIILEQFDCSITLKSGHNYEILEDNTIIYEYKTGPYLGVDKDKEMLSHD